MATRRQRRSDRLLRTVEPFRNLVILTHDNPDPDAIATGWALLRLLSERTDHNVRLVGGGDIVRAENRQMVRLLKPPLELVSQLVVDDSTGVVLVDCGLEATNHLLAGHMDRVVAVLDHHPARKRPRGIFLDVRPRVTASATIAATYLRQQNIEPDAPLATGMLYAIESETRGYETHFSPTDRSVLPWLMRYADPQQLAEIQNAPLERDYYGDLVLALQSTFTYDGAAFCLLPRAEGPEIVGEVADLLVRCDTIRRVLCGAAFDGDLLLSVRTDHAGGNASQLLRKTIDGLGFGNGHTHRAGGKLPRVAEGRRIPEAMEDQLRDRWLQACGIHRHRGTRLVPRREIVKNL